MANRNKTIPQGSAPTGFCLYQDKKNRTIYKHPLYDKAVYIPAYDFKTFGLYQKRYILAISVFIVLFAVVADWFNMPWWVSVAIAIAVWLALEVKFYRFIKSEQPVKSFKPEEYTGYIDHVREKDPKKSLLLIVLYLILAALIVYNSYYSGYDSMSVMASWVVGGIILVYALFQIVILFKARAK